VRSTGTDWSFLGDQRHLAREGADIRDLPDDAVAVDHRHARLDAVREALVDDDLAHERVARVVEDFGDDAAIVVASTAIGHGEDLLVLGAQHLRLLRRGGVLEHLHLEVRVLAQQPVLAREVIAGATEELPGQRRELLDGMGEDREGEAYRFERVEPVVGDHQRDRNDREESEPGEGTGTPVEESRRLMNHAPPPSRW
jgi:hypothetical protein